jgi:predicted NBD/HSP70 family sugar kinase
VTRPGAVRPEEMRRHNLSLVLGEIHLHGAQSRAELTAVLGLNRSTIGALVSDLVDLGLVAEHLPAQRIRAGRPSHVVAPRGDGPYVLAVEVAVGRVLSAAVGLGGEILAQRETRLTTRSRGPKSVVKIIAADASWLATQIPLNSVRVGVGVSVPGLVRESDGFVNQAPNLGWRKVEFGALLSTALDETDVYIGNDGDLGAIAEHRRGAGRRFEHLVYVNGSVGVGAGIISNGRPVRGAGGYAGEIGHIMLNPDGPSCHCGSTGCVESYVGESALLVAAGASATHSSDAVAEVFSRVRAGDQQACDAVETVAVWLGRALAGVINVFNPQAVIVGGSLAEVMRLGAATVEAELDRRAMAAARSDVVILLSGLDSSSSLVGAAEVAFQPLLSAPDMAQLAAAN